MPSLPGTENQHERDMVAQASELVSGLSSKEAKERLRCLKQIKNQVIGNKSKKICFLKAGAVRLLVSMLNSESDMEIKSQTATTLGSIASGTQEGVEQLLKLSGIDGLVQALSTQEFKVVEACVRSLKLLYVKAGFSLPHAPILAEKTLKLLIPLLGAYDLHPDLSSTAATLLAFCCRPEQQVILTRAPILEAARGMLLSNRKPLQTSALGLLSCLLLENPKACKLLLQTENRASSSEPCQLLVVLLVKLLKDWCSFTRFTASCCLTYLSTYKEEQSSLQDMKAGEEVESPAHITGCSRRLEEASSSSVNSFPALNVNLKDVLERSKVAVLPVLLRLLSEKEMQDLVPTVLAKLIENNEELQRAALDADAVKLLAMMLSPPSNSTPSASVPSSSSGNTVPLSSGSVGMTPPKQEGILKALCNLCMDQNTGRKQLLEAKVMQHILRCLEAPETGVRAAAAKCVMALSRSISNLRSGVMESGVVAVLCRLLTEDKCSRVQVNAAGALCNLGLEFSSVKEAVLSSGTLQHLVRMMSSTEDIEMRIQGCMALRNLAYKSDDSLKEIFMKAVTWPQMRSLIDSEELRLQGPAMCIVRNLCMGYEPSLQAVLNWGGSDLLACLEEKIDPTSCAHSSVVEHALYTVVNMLAGWEKQKEAVMQSNLPTMLMHILRTSPPATPASLQTLDLRVPALWCIINLVWLQGSMQSAVSLRVQKLRDLGIVEVLQNLQHSRNSRDVCERAKTAMDRIEAVKDFETSGDGNQASRDEDIIGPIMRASPW
ncbi:hypothetical protein CEUSTIGMA_g6878.t1 [Chlamydomonas eustigma]|uniref:Uncharacterized protein n=1 Tax=Chlamydomonas eustigma TaxID=1157962 RepID=A0A250X8Q1_9CHLO|nr:hypothetical protein CEUSTIGMA_g6878.t1 [Chlamydomonas eustigma]|eukprot:GAX79437.1 hypothetical protein CEUSTIGMA_g6878.t1 [Chlamydomonas eustigma]